MLDPWATKNCEESLYTVELPIKGHVLCREVACPLWQSGNSSCVLCREVVLFERVGPQVVSFVERLHVLFGRVGPQVVFFVERFVIL